MRYCSGFRRIILGVGQKLKYTVLKVPQPEMTTTPVTINNFMDVLQGLVDGYPRNDDFMYDLDDLAEREYDIHCNGVPETDFVRRQRDALLNDILSIYNFDPHQIVQTPDGDVTVWDVVIDNVYTYMNNHVTFE